MDGSKRLCTAFEGDRRIAHGALADVAVAVKRVVDRGETAPVLIFDDETSEQVEVDLRGTVDEVAARLGRPAEAPDEGPRGPGRPRLGVVARRFVGRGVRRRDVAETAGGVTTAVTARLYAHGRIKPDELTVSCITGNGLKTTDVLQGAYEQQIAVRPRLSDFSAYLEEQEDRVSGVAYAN